MIVLLGLTYAVGPAPPQQSLGFPSSYSSQWAGAKAAFLLLQEQGYRVERWEKSPEDLPGNSEGALLILAEPTERGSESERMAIRRFVSGGGRVLAMGAERGGSGSGHRCLVRGGVGPATQILSGAPPFADHARRARNHHGGARHVYVEHASMARALRRRRASRGVVVSASGRARSSGGLRRRLYRTARYATRTI